MVTDSRRWNTKISQELLPLSATDERLDPAVVAELYERFGEDLRRFLVGLLRDAQLAGDALQTTFAKLAEHGHATQPEARKGWLYRVAYNEAMLVRRRRAMDDAALRRTAWSREAVGESADVSAVRAEAVARVRRAIAALPAEQQQVVRMRMYEDKTFAVIAEELGIPLGTALARMRAATIKLRARLEDEA